MKNFILKQALTFQGSTIESFLALLGEQFLATYPQMEQLRLTGRELPFTAVPVPQDNSSLTPLSMSALLPYALPTPTFSDSNVLFKRSHDDFAVASLDYTRDGSGGGNAIITAHQSGRVGLQLLKVTGSSFTHFVRDAYTTLPERVDRPLFIYLDVFWKYSNLADVLAPDLASPTQGREGIERRSASSAQGPYVPSEQVRDLVQVVFHEFVSESIQHLVNEIGMRLLARFPQLSEVSFDAQNRTRDPVVVSDTNPKLKVYSDPFPAYGMIKLTLTRAQ